MDRFTNMSSFVQVVDSKSFSRAARQLKLSQGTVTGHVQSLEQQLGVRLLNRTTRKGLTEEGLNSVNDVSGSLRKLPRSRTWRRLFSRRRVAICA